MNLLALDTSTSLAAVAVGRADGSVVVASIDSSQKHGRHLIPTIRAALREAGLAISDLQGVAVGLGPGSYTGLRIGLTAAKTLAYAANIPLVALNSLEILARNAPDQALRVAVIADAQRAEVYAADFVRSHPGSDLHADGPTRIEPISQWIAKFQPGTVCLGPAFERGGLELPPHATRGFDLPDPHHLMALARQVWQSGKRDDPWFLEPFYLRRSAAEDLWDARLTPTPSVSHEQH